MSLILDALKKLEQDKAARQSRQLDLRPAITGRRPLPRSSRWPLPVLLAGGVIILSAVAVITIMYGYPTQHQPAQGPALDNGAMRTQTLPSLPPTPPHQESFPQNQYMERTGSPPSQIASPKVAPPALQSQTQRTRSYNESVTSDLSVTGIAWQEVKNARRAVINGVLAREGEIIAGARIIEIRPDQVVFSRNSQVVTVSISSGNH